MSIVCLRIEDGGSLLYSCQHCCYRQQKFFHLFICFPQNAKQPISKVTEQQKELFYLTYLGSVPINLCLAFIWMRFGILLYREVRKKWFPSERRVSNLWGTRHTAVQHPACARGSILASRAPISALKDNIRNHHQCISMS